MNRWVAALTASSALLLSGCSTALTPEALSPSFAEVFSGLYAKQQALLGRTDVHRQDLRTAADCRRTGTAPDGPGDDWVCAVQYLDLGAGSTAAFEVQVKPDGCWQADGSPTRQPAVLPDALTGRAVVNPLLEFDGCLDTAWH